MSRLKRLTSSLLFAAGLVIVFTGLSAALGFTFPGIVASLGVVAALLYAGAVWFGDTGATVAPAVIVFDRELRIAGGPHAGEPVAARFPASIRDEIQRRCTAAVGGVHSHFICMDDGRQRVFDAAPVLSTQASAICGVLVEGATAAAPRVDTGAALSAV